jgi:hypothetical protein
MGGAFCTNEERTAYRLLVEKSEGKRPLGRPIHSCVNNIKMDVMEKKFGDGD